MNLQLYNLIKYKTKKMIHLKVEVHIRFKSSKS